MYLRYYGFRDHPFSITPDPAFLYLSAHHREAFGHLLYGTGEHGGFVQLTGEVGTGKTTLIRALLAQDIEDVDVALCLNPCLTGNEFVAAICDELGVEYPGQATLKTLIDALNAHLLEMHTAGRRTVLILDEAQNLSRDVLEQVRLLTNLETHKHKLLRIILVGQPELAQMLRRSDLRQLAQRITARYHLRSLGRRETAAYIRHRLARVGGDPHLFTAAACAAAYRRSGGVPRLINIVCERALMGGYSRNRRRINARTVRRAAGETLQRRGVTGRGWRAVLAPTAALVGAIGLALALHYGSGGDASPTVALTGVLGGDFPDGREVTPAAPGPAAEAEIESQAPAVKSEEGGNETPPARPASSESRLIEEEETLPAGNAGLDQLLRLWGVFGSPVDDGCARLVVGDLRCFSGRGGFAELERYDRPALLLLKTAEGHRRVVLRRLSADTATLVFPEGTRELRRTRLAELWTGEFDLIWRKTASPGFAAVGTVGESVVWLRRRLTLARGGNPETRVGRPSPVFDEALETELRRFQITHGLEPDGLLGPRTMVVLENWSPTPGTPRLRGEGG
jgi:general secretion pathway protein A